jgi:surface antigen
VTVPVAAPLPAGSNGYAWGNCTWWAAARRAQLGQPIPNSWGNAASWAVRAGRDGYRVDHSPSPGAIMQTPYSAGGLGHVAIVEQVDADGTWHISEMNVLGLNIVDHAARTAAAATHYSFIH